MQNAIQLRWYSVLIAVSVYLLPGQAATSVVESGRGRRTGGSGGGADSLRKRDHVLLRDIRQYQQNVVDWPATYSFNRGIPEAQNLSFLLISGVGDRNFTDNGGKIFDVCLNVHGGRTRVG